MQSHLLTLLIERAKAAYDEALAQRAQSHQRLRQASEQLHVLSGYAREYQARQRAQLQQKADPAAKINWHAFAGKLDEAMTAQQDEVRAREQQLIAGDRQMQAARRRLQSLQALAERREAAARMRARRLEQKLTDEIARSRRSFPDDL